mmetsp:Transcript_118511/g.340304  ORF Transcript_118511/g.340304 Transcript_118511/m.340304 type:complete len:357 (-) Transcript_118511:41-1111(-)
MTFPYSMMVIVAFGSSIVFHQATTAVAFSIHSNSVSRSCSSSMGRAFPSFPQRQPQLATTNDDFSLESLSTSRRQWLQNSMISLSTMAGFLDTLVLFPNVARGDSSSEPPPLASQVTDKIFLEIKGLPSSSSEGNSASSASATTKRIVIGLFGKDAPQSVEKLKKLVSDEGLPAPCKPREERAFQREQLEANKVYNSCIEGQDKGVNYDYAQIWRVIQGERIDFGSVAGRFVAREYPSWVETTPNTLKHDRPGLVSVRRGSDSGFGFTVYPGGNGDVDDLNENHIIVGQVIEGMDVIQTLNNVPVVTSAKVNYMALTGGPNNKSAPSRACRYGGAMYCNENKPLIKLTIYKTGLVA